MEDSLMNSKLAQYMENCVKAQPGWVKKLFEEEKVSFTITRDDYLGVCFLKRVPKHFRDSLLRRISHYIQTNKLEDVKCEIN
jgi:hypothetical protein